MGQVVGKEGLLTPAWLTFGMASLVQVIAVVIVITTLRNRLDNVVKELQRLSGAEVALATLTNSFATVAREVEFLRVWKHDHAVPLDARVQLLEIKVHDITSRLRPGPSNNFP